MQRKQTKNGPSFEFQSDLVSRLNLRLLLSKTLFKKSLL